MEQQQQPKRRKTTSGVPVQTQVDDDVQLDQLIHRLKGSKAAQHLSKASPIFTELETYVTYLYSNCKDNDSIDFTQFWLANAVMFPVLSRIARRIIAGSACSFDVER